MLWIDSKELGVKLSVIRNESNSQQMAKKMCRESTTEGWGCARWIRAMAGMLGVKRELRER